MLILSHVPTLTQFFDFQVSKSLFPPKNLVLVLLHQQKSIQKIAKLLFFNKNSYKKGLEFVKNIAQNDMIFENEVYSVKNKDYVRGLEKYYEEECSVSKRKVENDVAISKMEYSVMKRGKGEVLEGDVCKLTKSRVNLCVECNLLKRKITVIEDTECNKRKKREEGSKADIKRDEGCKQNESDKQIQVESKKTTQSILKYNFTKLETKENEIDKTLRFKPIYTDPKMTFKFNDLRFRRRFTLRRQKEINCPVKLTFVKFHDQIKPPVYEKVDKKRNRNTLKVIENVDYEFDSDAEWIYEDGESVDISESESDEDTTTDDDWIEKDGEEVVKKYEKAMICFDNVGFDIWKTDEDWLNIPLRKTSVFPEELTEKLRMMEGRDDVIVKRFALEHRIVNNTVAKKLKEIKME